MDIDDFQTLVARDAQIVEALASALQAMFLVNGSMIVSAGIDGVLRFEAEMLQVHEALLLMGVNSKCLNIVPDEAPEKLHQSEVLLLPGKP